MKNQFSVLHLAIVSGLAMASTSALAQSDVSSTDQSIERLIVTGDLSGLGVDEIANSATIIDESLIELRNAAHLEDILATAANVSLTSGASRAKFVQIRAIGERSQFSEPVNPSVGIMLDGWDVSGLGSLGVLLDVAQVEVLRGPQATAYGTSGLAGVLNIVSKQPTEEASGDVSLTLGQDNQLEVKAAYGQALNDSVRFRGAFSQVQNNGFVRNAYLQADDTNNINESAGRFTLEMDTSDDSVLTLQALKLDINNGYDAFSLDNDNVTLSDQPGKDDSQATGVALKYAVSEDWGTYSLHAGQIHSESDYAYDEDWTYPGFHPWEYASVDQYERERDTATLEFTARSHRLANPAQAAAQASDQTPLASKSQDADLATAWVVGAFYKASEEALERTYTYADPNFTSVYEPEQLAIFGQVDAQIAPQVTLETGLRVERAQIYYADNSGFTENNDDTLIGGKIALRYQSNDNTVYSSISRGYKMGGFNPDQRVADSQRIFGAEYNWNYEVGVKRRFADAQLRLTAFYMQRKNTQISDFTTFVNDANVTEFIDVIANADNGTNRGVELEWAWQPNAATQLGANIGLLDATYSGYTQADGTVISEQDAAQAPKITYSVFGDLQLTDAWGVNVQVEGRSRHRFSDGHEVENPAYAVLNASARYQYKDIELQFSVKNMLDKTYYVRGFGGFSNDPRDYYETPEPYYQWGNGRRFAVTASYSF